MINKITSKTKKIKKLFMKNTIGMIKIISKSNRRKIIVTKKNGKEYDFRVESVALIPHSNGLSIKPEIKVIPTTILIKTPSASKNKKSKLISLKIINKSLL